MPHRLFFCVLAGIVLPKGADHKILYREKNGEKFVI